MSVRGIFASHSSIVGDRVGDYNSRLLTTGFAAQAPMTALSSGMPKESVQDTSFSWTEDDEIVGHTTASATALSGDTSITVVDSNIWIPNSIIQNQVTGEHIYITAIAGNVLTVTRGFAGTVPTAVAIGHRFQLIGTAFAEASRGAAAVLTMGESRTSFVQIFKAAWSLSGSATAVQYRSGPKLAKSRADANQRLIDQLESAAIFSRPSVSRVTTVDGIQELRTTAGLDYSIRTYGGTVTVPAANAVTGRLNLEILLDFIRTIFDRNVKGQPNERLTFCGSSFVSLIQRMVMDLDGYSFSVKESEYGIQVVTLITPNGKLTLMTHPMFVGNPLLQNELYVWHPGGVKRRVLRDFSVVPRDMANQPDARDAVTGDILLEMGYEIRGASVMGILSGTVSAGGLAALPTS